MNSNPSHTSVRPLPRPRPVGLALQGGGSWGAYTWGALDALLASRSVEIRQLSGTSGGAISVLRRIAQPFERVKPFAPDELLECVNVGACVMSSHSMVGVAEQHFAIFHRYTDRA